MANGGRFQAWLSACRREWLAGSVCLLATYGIWFLRLGNALGLSGENLTWVVGLAPPLAVVGATLSLGLEAFWPNPRRATGTAARIVLHFFLNEPILVVFAGLVWNGWVHRGASFELSNEADAGLVIAVLAPAFLAAAVASFLLVKWTGTLRNRRTLIALWISALVCWEVWSRVAPSWTTDEPHVLVIAILIIGVGLTYFRLWSPSTPSTAPFPSRLRSR